MIVILQYLYLLVLYIIWNQMSIRQNTFSIYWIPVIPNLMV